MSFISIVVPAYNEEKNLSQLWERIQKVMEISNRSFELLVVENGSTDRSLEILKELHEQDKRIQYLSLSRNFGHQSALIAGMEHSRGDVVITMDADLQHPPELIPKMLKLWKEGYAVVYTNYRENRAQPFLRRLLNRFFYSLISRLSGLPLSGGQSDFRLMDRKVVDILCAMPERNKFLRGLTKWIGFRQIGIDYDISPRFSGKTKFRFAHLIRFALDGILSFSIIPLRIFLLVGAVISAVAFLYGIYIVGIGAYAYFTGYSDRVPPGWATVTAAVLFFGGIQLIGIGLLGEYLGRVYDEAKERPVYLIREQSLRPAGKSATPLRHEP